MGFGTGRFRPSATLSQRERGFDTPWKAGIQRVAKGVEILGRHFWTPGFAGGVVQNISTVEVKAEQAKIVRGTV